MTDRKPQMMNFFTIQFIIDFRQQNYEVLKMKEKMIKVQQLMLNIIILIGENQKKTETFFNQIPFSKNQIFEKWCQKHQEYDVFLYRAVAFETYNYSLSGYFKSFERDQVINKNQVIGYFIYPSTYQNRNFSNFVPPAIKQKLTILYDDETVKNLEKYKSDYKTQKITHINEIEDYFQSLFPEQETETISAEMAILIGEAGVGKTQLFQKATGQQKDIKSKFNSFYFKNEDFQLVDSPSLQIKSRQNEQIMKKYNTFLTKNAHVISTFFLLIEFDRFDQMKNKFFNLHTYFKNFSQSLIVIVTQWEKSFGDEQVAMGSQLKHYFLNISKIRNVIFMESTITSDFLKQSLKSQLTGQLGIDLEDTIFSLEDDQETIQNLTNQANKIEQAAQQQKYNQNYQEAQNLQNENQSLSYEVNQLEEQLRVLKAELENKKYLIQEKKKKIDQNTTIIRNLQGENQMLNQKIKQQQRV